MLRESWHHCAVWRYFDNAPFPKGHPDIAVGIDAETIAVFLDTESGCSSRIVAQQRPTHRPQYPVPIDQTTGPFIPAFLNSVIQRSTRVKSTINLPLSFLRSSDTLPQKNCKASKPLRARSLRCSGVISRSLAPQKAPKKYAGLRCKLKG